MAELRLLFTELVRLEIELWNAVDTRLRAELNLPLSSYEPMQVIARRESCRVQDIADDMVITVGGTSKLVDRLESAGHCRRALNPADRRSSLIELTPAGRELLAAAAEVIDDELETRIGTVLSAGSRERLVRMLITLRSAGHRADVTVAAQAR